MHALHVELLLDPLHVNQVVVYVNTTEQVRRLTTVLQQCQFSCCCVTADMSSTGRQAVYDSFRKRSKRLLVLTDATEDSSANLGANVVINYDTPQLLYQVYSDRADTYMCRVDHAGWIGSKGLAITLVASAEDADVLNQVQDRFDVDIVQLPDCTHRRGNKS